MTVKNQVSVRLDAAHLKELEDLQPHYGNSRGEVARYLLVEALQAKYGMDRLRQRKAIR